MSNKIDKSNVLAVLELSMTQQAILFHYLRETDVPIYNVQLALELRGELNVLVLEQTLQQIQLYNDALRSVFRWEAVHKPVQIVLKNAPLQFFYHDLSMGQGVGKISDLAAYLHQDYYARFDLTQVPLRVHCLKIEEHKHILVITHHHILYDGWSTGILLKEIISIYRQLSKQQAVHFAVKPALSAMHIALQKRRQVAQQNQYWAYYLQGYEPKSILGRNQHSHRISTKKYNLQFSLTPIDDLAATHRVTRAVIIYTTYGLLLRKYFNHEDVVFGTVVSTRDIELKGADAVIGNFINTIPLRINPNTEGTLQEVLEYTQSSLMERMPYTQTSYAEIKTLLTLGLDEQLFDSAVVIENYPIDPAIIDEQQDLSIKLHHVQESTDIPLLLTVYFNEFLELEFAYQDWIGAQFDVVAFARQFLQILTHLCEQPKQKLDLLDILSTSERQLVTETFNATNCPYPMETNVMALFEAQVVRTPHEKAFQYGSSQWTYQQLDNYAGKIAGYLKRVHQVESGTLIGVMLEREELLIPIIFGILKAGCSYVPIDPQFPILRIVQIVEDSGMSLIFTRQKFISNSLIFSGWLDLDQLDQEINNQPLYRAIIAPHSLAYIIYTSGSTGKPKGVMIEHHSVVNRLVWMQKKYPVTTSDVFIQKTPIVFDVSVWELFWWSFTGASLYILPPGGEKDPLMLVKAIEQKQVSVIHFVPSMLGSFLNSLDGIAPTSLASLRYVFTSGEALQYPHVLAFQAHLYKTNASRLINLYGPTEATVDVSYYECNFTDAIPNLIPIGKPIDNTRLFILDKWGFPVPVGVPGELCIAGVGLARGYLNQSELSAEKFIAHPRVLKERIYLTGDLAKWDSSGNILFMGRLDNQIKLRGLRIELGEVEYQLCQLGGIRDGVVVVKEIGGEPYLVAYYLADKAEDQATLKSLLASNLPEYMIPSFLVQLEQWPLSNNGKLDRKALPLPLMDWQRNAEDQPSNELEAQLVSLWADLLKLEPDTFGVNRSFFELGGHSLKAISLIAELYRAFKIRVPLYEIFQLLTIKALAQYINAHRIPEVSAITPAAFASAYPLSPVQERLYFSYQFDNTATIYNGGIILLLNGVPDIQKIEGAFQALLQRHEILRTAFVMSEDGPMQIVLENLPFKLDSLLLEPGISPHLQYILFVKPFDLSRPPLIRAGLGQISDNQFILLIDIHHIANDGLSRELLIRDFSALYKQEALHTPALQYKDYAVWCRQNSEQEWQLRQKLFWENQFTSIPQAMGLPYDFERPATNVHPAARNSFTIDEQLTRDLKQLAQQEGVTLFTLLLAVFNVLLAKFSNQEDVVIGTPVSGRDFPGLDVVLGMFVNTLPLRNQVTGDQPFSAFLQNVKANTLSAFGNQSFAYGDMVSMLQVERDQSRNPLFDVLFAYQDYQVAEIEIPGVEIQIVEPGHHSIEFDLILSISNAQRSDMSAHFEFAKDLFREETIQRMAICFVNIIRTITAAPSIPIAQIDYLPQVELKELIETLQPNKTELPAGASIYALFYTQVKQAPQNIALIQGDTSITYNALHGKVQRIAAQISPQIKAGKERVALFFEPSIDMAAAILAVIYAGGTYVPLSTEAPLERNLYILQDSEAKVLLTGQDLVWRTDVAAISACVETVVLVDSAYSPEAGPLLEQMAKPHSSVYIIYTSGTSGDPKGVAVRHEGLLNYVCWNMSAHGLTNADRSLQLVAYHFDGFAANFYPVLLAGGSMVSVSAQEKLNPDFLATLIAEQRITHLATLPSLYAEILAALPAYQPQLALRFVVLAGEKASTALVRQSQNQLPSVQLKNEYGPTETTIAATHNHRLEAEGNTVIGTPIANTSVWILDKYQGLLPRGVKGELCVAGKGLAAGYINNERLNADKFIQHPYIPGENLYRTGDIARWLPTGELELFSRIDDQIKIRGFRIEPAEIERQLTGYATITDALVAPWQHQHNTILVAYYTGSKKLDRHELRSWLSTRLPDYMVPNVYVYMEAFPYTSIGKVDKKALPEPILEAESGTFARTAEEHLLSMVWKEVLGMEQIGIHDNFFALGGDSIKSIQVCSRMRTHGYELKVRDIFSMPTIQSLAQILQQRNNDSPGNHRYVYKTTLSPIQTWFLEGPIQHKHHFNHTLLLSLAPEISPTQIHRAFDKIAEHHDMLRASFYQEDTEWKQEIKAKSAAISLEVYELRGDVDPTSSILTLGNQLQRTLNIEEGQLLRLCYFQSDAGPFLLIVIHHLIIDGISWRILLEDLNILWAQMHQQIPLALPIESMPYLSWADQMIAFTQTSAFNENKKHWQNIKEAHKSSLAKDFPQGRNTFADVQTLEFKLSESKTLQLLQQVHAAYGTHTHEILTAALVYTFHQQFGFEAIQIDLEGHGRHEAFGEDTSRTLGWFTSIYPVIFELQEANLEDAIIQTKEAMRRVPLQGADFLLQHYAVQKTFPELSEISFNYLGQFDSDFSSPFFSLTDALLFETIDPQEERLYLWEITGMLVNAQLQLNLSYSRNQFKSTTIEAFVQRYQDNLMAMIEHCRHCKARIFTPVDFTFQKLSLAQVRELPFLPILEDVCTLSPMQEGMLFLSLMNPEADDYFEQAIIHIQGHVALDVFRQSMQDLGNRHPILRTIFLHRDLDRPLQLVLQHREIEVKYTKLVGLNGSSEQAIQEIARIDRQQKFDLSKDLLFRLHLIQTGDTSFTLMMSHHHILMDGWCMGIILNEFKQLYAHHLGLQELNLAPVRPYAHFVAWLEKRDQTDSRRFWAEYLHGYSSASGLPRRDSLSSERQMISHNLSLSQQLSAQLQATAQKHGVTINHLCQLAWGILLAHYQQQNDNLFGTVVAGRPAELEEAEQIVGLFINTLPIRLQWLPEETIASALHHLRDAALEMDPHQYTPLAEIQSISELGNTLFDHLLIFENYPFKEELLQEEGTGFSITQVDFFDQVHYDLSVVVVPKETLCFRFNFNAACYEQALIAQVSTQLELIFEQLCQDEQRAIKDIALWDESTQLRLLSTCNDTQHEWDEPAHILHLLANQVAAHPNRLALSDGSIELSYAELERASNQIAVYLQNRFKIGTNDLVGVLMDREIHLIPTLLGILKAGAAFVPIDTQYPVSRVADIMRDAQLKLLISRATYLDSTLLNLAPVMDWDTCTQEVQSTIETNFKPYLDEDSLAYVIYTSGSTGRPKGVMISHCSLHNYLRWAQEMYVQEPCATFALYSSIAFDLTLTSIFTPLIGGHNIALYEGDESSLLLQKAIEDNRASVLKLTPSHLKVIRDTYRSSDLKTQKLRTLIVGGEDLDTHLARQIDTLFEGRVAIYNEYGPTEATVGCMIYAFTPEDNYTSVPIGYPAYNTQIYILDPHLRPVPPGMLGELYIAGKGLAKGYLHNEALTASRFLPNPWMDAASMYKTGDLAVRTFDHKILYKGRLDEQVKLRGFRIELSEIESHLVAITELKEACVILQGPKADPYLVAYCVPTTQEITPHQIRDTFGIHLPAYMIPAHFVFLDHLPLSSNGKIDRKALPALEYNYSTGASPNTATEKKMALIWGDLLKIEPDKLSTNDHFFTLGGHSLKALSLLNHIRREWGTEISLKDIFRYPKLGDLVQLLDENVNGRGQTILKAAQKTHYTLSAAQKRMYILYQLDKSSLAYNMPHVFKLLGSVDADRLEGAFNQLVERHEILRTVFREEAQGGVAQVVLAAKPLRMARILSITPDGQAEIAQIVQPFNLESGPLLRIALITLNSSTHLLVVDMHHIITDGISQELMIRDFLDLYQGKSLPILDLQYKDYAEWQQSPAQQENWKKQQQYWLKQFEDEIPVLNLPTDFSRPLVKDNLGSAVGFELKPELVDAINKLAREEDTTVFVILLAAWSILLSKLSTQEDLVIGTPTAGRNHSDIEQMVGMFVNTLALRCRPEGSLTIVDYLRELQHSTISHFDHQLYQYENLVNDLKLDRDTSRNPLFDVMLVLQNFEVSSFSLPELQIVPLSTEHNISKFDLLLSGAESGGRMSFMLEYASALFTRASIERFVAYFQKILEGVCTNSAQKIAAIDWTTEQEKWQVTEGFNATDAAYSADGNVLTLFEEQVQRTPQYPAVQFGDLVFTYAELNDWAGRFAGYLKHVEQVSPGQLIGVMLEREAFLIPCIYGILKAGCAYIPIDPHFPSERIQSIITDSGMCNIFTRSPFRSDQILFDKWIDLDTTLPEIQKQEKIREVIQGKDLAYVIYTSGSTGKPKGVMIEHHAVLNRLNWMQKKYPIDHRDVLVLKTPIVFDVSVGEIFGWAFTGAKLYLLPPGMEKEPLQLIEVIDQQKITVIHFVASMLGIFLNSLEQREDYHKLQSIRRVLTSGEAVQPAHATLFSRTLFQHCQASLINLYGPTEASIEVSYYECNFLEPTPSSIPIGKPIDNIRLYIVDRHGNPVPIGVTGELCIAGVGLARGYLNNKPLSQEKFLEHPPVLPERIYKTGDLVKWQPDGNIAFLGRIDNQIKLRGLRIELGEIEYQLSAYPHIQDVVVLLKEKQGDPQLVAYYVAAAPLANELLRAHLLKTLPEYMTPTYFIHLTTFPLSVNGKLDRKALPEPQFNLAKQQAMPTSSTEWRLLSIWAEVLKLEGAQIGSHRSFFELGGHSIAALHLINFINKEFAITLNLREVFAQDTVAKMAQWIEEHEKSVALPIPRATTQRMYPVSAAQERLYYLQMLDILSVAYNISGVFEVRNNLSINDLENYFEHLIKRHEILRTNFIFDQEQLWQQVHPHIKFELSVSQQNPLETISAIFNDFIQAFDLSSDVLLRGKLVHTLDGKRLLMVDIHHIICDGLSLNILMQDFRNICQRVGLTDPGTRYLDYAVWQRSTPLELGASKEYWQQQLAAVPPMLDLPVINPRREVKINKAALHLLTIEEKDYQAILQVLQKTKTTPFMFLLSVYYLLLSKISGENELIIGTDAVGRTHQSIRQTIGTFVNLLPLRMQVPEDLSFVEFLQAVKKIVLKGFEHQDFQYDQMIDLIKWDSQLHGYPLVQVHFAYANFIEPWDKWPDADLVPYNIERDLSTQYEFKIEARAEGQQFQLNFVYSTDLYTEPFIRVLSRYYLNIVRAVVAYPTILLEAIELESDHTA